MIKYFFIIIFSILSFTGSSLSEKADENLKVEMYEVCADDLFVRQFGDKFRYYLSMHVKTKIYKNKVYQWLYEDCENTNDPKIKVCKYSNGTYTGEMKAFRRHGQGEYIWDSGKTFKGKWIEGKADEKNNS